MISATSEPTDEQIETAKAAWNEPVVVRIDVGDAEAGDGVGTDGGIFIS